jgi:pyruvate kinase
VGRRTKIVATLGPASSDAAELCALVEAGVDVVRLNLSHGEPGEHLAWIDRVRAASATTGRVVATLADLPGPKVRCGQFPDGGVRLAAGSEVRLVPGSGGSSEDTIHVDYASLLDDVAPGDRLLIGDGGITLRADAVGRGFATAEVVSGGRATGRPGFHIPSERLRLRTPTERDGELLRLLAAQPDPVDFVAVSFVRSADDILEVRNLLGDAPVRIVAKIETVPALTHLDGILDTADAVMVARGDLGIELPLEEVPHAQKRIIRAAVEAGVPVITATQMLESMITAPSPTRAEVSDVANAVYDGTDALMLSGETAIGADPPLVVRTMARIAERAELDADYSQWGGYLAKVQRRRANPTPITQAVTHAAWQAAHDVGAVAVVCSTRSGLTAMAMARFRPSCRLIGLSAEPRTVRALALVWGIEAGPVKASMSTDEMVWHVVEQAVVNGHAHPGEVLVVLARSPDAPDSSTDVLRIVRVG